jgi:hypothetical protein
MILKNPNEAVILRVPIMARPQLMAADAFAALNASMRTHETMAMAERRLLYKENQEDSDAEVKLFGDMVLSCDATYRDVQRSLPPGSQGRFA